MVGKYREEWRWLKFWVSDRLNGAEFVGRHMGALFAEGGEGTQQGGVEYVGECGCFKVEAYSSDWIAGRN